MDEKEAWKYIQISFQSKNLKDNFFDVYSSYNGQMSHGMCHTISYLLDKKLISHRVFKLLKQKINKYSKRGYLYPTTFYGARKRREFCRDRIKELDNVLTNRFSST